MLMAVLGDIHGNGTALDAALAIIDGLGIQTILNTGDCVGGGSSPNEVIEQLKLYRVVSVQGEMDRRVALYRRKRQQMAGRLAPEVLEQVRQANEALRSEYIEFLGRLPRRSFHTWEGLSVCLCHGTPSTPLDELHEDDDAMKFRREREVANANIVALGKTHRPFAREVDAALFVNPGSLGVPSGGGATGTFAIVDTEQEPWRVTFREVAL